MKHLTFPFSIRYHHPEFKFYTTKTDYKDPLCKCHFCLTSENQNRGLPESPPPSFKGKTNSAHYLDLFCLREFSGRLRDQAEALFHCQIIPSTSFLELLRTQHDLTDTTKPTLIFSNIIAFHRTLQRKMSPEFKKDSEIGKMFTTEERGKLSYKA